MAEFQIIISDLPTSENQEFIDLVGIQVVGYDRTKEISPAERFTESIVEVLRKIYDKSANLIQPTDTDSSEKVH